VLVDDLDLHTVMVQHPFEKDTMILAESTDPEYTEGLNCYSHEESKKIKKEWTKADLKRLGPNADALARAKLMERIKNEADIGKKRLRKLTHERHSKLQTDNREVPISKPSLQATLPPIVDHNAIPMPSSDSTALTSASMGKIVPFECFELEI